MTKTTTPTPRTVGIIMDGNRRWAKEQGLPTIEGHRKGVETLQACTRWAYEMGVKTLIVYAFSTENWQRSEEEVTGIMDLVAFFSEYIADTAIKEGVRIQFIGKRDMLPEKTLQKIETLERATAIGTTITLVVALSYGGRLEIVEAARSLSESDRAELTEESFAKKLWTADISDPDIIIRTGGQKRLSNFLLWQSAYSELFFTPTYWPAFTRDEFARMVTEYGERVRNGGK